jgi:hypothetical protein
MIECIVLQDSVILYYSGGKYYQYLSILSTLNFIPNYKMLGEVCGDHSWGLGEKCENKSR